MKNMKAFGALLRRKSPEILTGVGITGMVGTVVLAVRGTPKALLRIRAKKKELNVEKLTVAQTVEATWKCYIPAALTGGASIACLVGASTVAGRRNAALMTAASVASDALNEYREKVVETVGEKKAEAIQDAVDRDRVKRNPPPARELPRTEGAVAPVLCYDALFGRYFYSDVETLRRAANKLNWQMNNGSEPYISLNEWYAEINLSSVDVGYDLGWRNDRGLIELRFSSQLVNGNTPCLVVTHINAPCYDYRDA